MPDGDIQLDLRLDHQYAYLINAANIKHNHAWLVAEIVPADEFGCAPGHPPKPASGIENYGLCTGAGLIAPPIGSRIAATGPLVLDIEVGWMEIHPVWRVVQLPTSVPAPVSSAALRILSISPNPVARGRDATVTAQTTAYTLCSMSVTYSSGAVSAAPGLGSATADSSGHVRWVWKVEAMADSGQASAEVVCGSLSARGLFNVT